MYDMKEENYGRWSCSLKFFHLGNMTECVLQPKEFHSAHIPPASPSAGIWDGEEQFYFSGTPKLASSTDAIYLISSAEFSLSWIWKSLNIQN